MIGLFTVGDAEYFGFDGLSKSDADLLLECPALYRARKDGCQEPDSAAYRIGSLLHCMALEPDEVEARYVRTDTTASSKAGKAVREQAAADGKTVISLSEWETANGMLEGIRRHAKANALLSLPGISEVACYWEEDVEDKPMQCKGKIDRLAKLPNGAEVCIDLKTTQGSVSREELGKKLANFHYYRQAGWYRRGLEAVGHPAASFVFIFVSKEPPHLVSAVTIPATAEAMGLEEMLKAAAILQECNSTNSWPCFMQDIEEIDLPAWAYRR